MKSNYVSENDFKVAPIAVALHATWYESYNLCVAPRSRVVLVLHLLTDVINEVTLVRRHVVTLAGDVRH